MFDAGDIIYEDNHLLVVNKHCGDLVQPDPGGGSALETEIKRFIKARDGKSGEVFLGVVHRIDRPVSGAVLFAKTSKALVRMNEQIRERKVDKRYWAITGNAPAVHSGDLTHHIERDPKTNRSRALDKPTGESREARLSYRVLAHSDNYHLLEVELHTGRHHQIRAQLSKIGCPIKGDLKYGAARSNRRRSEGQRELAHGRPSEEEEKTFNESCNRRSDLNTHEESRSWLHEAKADARERKDFSTNSLNNGGGISLHSRSMEFTHPVRGERIKVTAPVPADDRLWAFFEEQAE